MSAQDDEGFLSRWSRRKRVARDAASERGRPPAAVAPPQPPQAAGKAAEAAEAAEAREGPAAAADGPGAPALPPLPDIATLTADSDIRAFMRPGVPPALRRAALARIWSLDPAIRDFREMADYDWDFNAAGGAPGYGGLEASAEEIERWAARILPPRAAEPAAAEPPAAEPAVPPAPDAPYQAPAPAAVRLPAAAPESAPGSAPGSGHETDPASSPAPPPNRELAAPRPRRHGGAVPT